MRTASSTTATRPVAAAIATYPPRRAISGVSCSIPPGRTPSGAGRRASCRAWTTPYAQILNGGNDVEYFDEEICAGDLLTASAKIEGFNERYSSALGGPMLIQVTSITYKNQHGTVVAVMRNTSLSYGEKKES